MTTPFSSAMAKTFAPPVMEARKWLDRANATLPVLNLSQAAPIDPPTKELREEIARVAQDVPQSHLYGPVLGLPQLREALGHRWTALYGSTIAPDQVAITSGCNQAFAAAVATLADAGDQVILPVPWYFNHKMWLDMSGIEAVALPCDLDMLPSLARAEALITPKTRAIALVTPNNPTGVEYPPALIADFVALCRKHSIALIIDETYRDFHSCNGPPHSIFADPYWEDTVIQLYSFSKAYRLTGHRVGALIAARQRLAQIEKFLDTVTICPAQLGQFAALWGINHLDGWLAAERQEILARGQMIRDGFAQMSKWQLVSAGAYFAYVKHPFALTSRDLAQKLVQELSLLVLPGSMFMPENDPSGDTHIRIAFANADRAGINELFSRLRQFDAPLARTDALD